LCTEALIAAAVFEYLVEIGLVRIVASACSDSRTSADARAAILAKTAIKAIAAAAVKARAGAAGAKIAAAAIC